MDKEFLEAVTNMRKAQKSYFATKDPRIMANAKHWEKVVDSKLQILKGETLF